MASPTSYIRARSPNEHHLTQPLRNDSVPRPSSPSHKVPPFTDNSECTARDPLFLLQHFTLCGIPLRIPGYLCPWEQDNDVGDVSASLRKLQVAHGKEMRRQLWAMVQIARSGLVPDEVVFADPIYPASESDDDSSLSDGDLLTQFILRPSPRSAVPLQWVHISCQAIPDSLADLRCPEMSPAAILHLFNKLMNTEVSLDVDGLPEFLASISRASRDFGEAYGKVRSWWPPLGDELTPEMLTSGHDALRIERCEEAFNALRRDAVQGCSLQMSHIPPRRVWDLYSNRVLPFSAIVRDHDLTHLGGPYWVDTLLNDLWAISHSWAAEEDRENVWTPVNGMQWPVPIPRGTSLEHVRVELLNMGAEYVWLDVLCLRQQGRAQDESLRAEEWKTDVPTIGNIYRTYRIIRRCVTYFNGLGLPLDTSPRPVASDRHWFNRVWTLQETIEYWVPGGVTGELLTDGKQFFSRLDTLLDSLDEENQLEHPNHLIYALKHRHCTNELDRISGLAYIMGCKTLPLYDMKMGIEDAWQQLLKHIPGEWRSKIMAGYAVDTPLALFPSWSAYINSDANPIHDVA